MCILPCVSAEGEDSDVTLTTKVLFTCILEKQRGNQVSTVYNSMNIDCS